MISALAPTHSHIAEWLINLQNKQKMDFKGGGGDMYEC